MANRVERIQRNFYWEGVEGQDKFHLVGWEGVCSPIQYGGWGFTKLSLSTKPCWVSGYGDLEWSKSISGTPLSRKSMGNFREIGLQLL